MLGVDRQQRGAVPRHRRRHDLPRRNQRLLVGQRHDAPLLDRGHCGGEPRGPDDRGKDDVGGARGGFDEGGGSGGGFDSGSGERLAQRGQACVVGDHRDFG